jgi:hypothetical protein
MIGLHDAKAVQEKVLELNSKILDAQRATFAAHDERTTLIDRVRALEEENAGMKAWGAEKARYELKDLYRGLFAYIPKEGMEQGEPLHALCANCYQKGQKSILQTNGSISVHDRTWDCPNCKTKIKNQFISMPELIKKSRESNP